MVQGNSGLGSLTQHLCKLPSAEPLYDVSTFKQHLADNISSLIDNDPNSIIVLTGALNRLNTSELQTILRFEQILTIPTHNDNILDQFLTNRPDQFVAQVAPSLVQSKHKALIINSKADCVRAVARPQRTAVTFFDYPPLVSCSLRQALANFNWDGIIAAINCRTNSIDNIYNDFVNIVK